MTRKMRRGLLITGLAVTAVAGVLVLGGVSLKSMLYPRPSRMPPVVAEPLGQLLQEFETTLATRTSGTLERLQPGLTDRQIEAQEARGGVALGEELRTLYRWRNGVSGGPDPGIMEGHDFPPLERLVDELVEIKRQMAKLSLGQKAAMSLFAGHRTGWIPIFTDGAGDGYFYDPTRKPSEGAYFFCFSETADYVFFPSLRNILRGFLEGYGSGAIRQKSSGELEIDYQKMEAIWSMYGEPHRRTE